MLRVQTERARAPRTHELASPGGLAAGGIGSLAAGGAEARQGDGGAVGLTQGARGLAVSAQCVDDDDDPHEPWLDRGPAAPHME